LVGLGSEFLEMHLSLTLTDRHEFCTQVWCGVKPENLPTIFLPHPRKIWREKTSNFAELPPTRRQTEARNFEAAQNIDKQKRCIIYNKCAKTGTKLVGSPYDGF